MTAAGLLQHACRPHSHNPQPSLRHRNFTIEPAPFRTKPAVVWPGGKTRLLKVILPLIPAHTCYCEPFSGGLAVLLAKPRSTHEVVNDINGDLVAFYRCVRFHREPLLTELEFVLNSRKEFIDFRAQPGLTDIQRAARWFFRNKMGFGGNSEAFRVSVSSAPSSREGRMEAIRQLSLRLDRATIENLTWQRCLELYDRATTFFFLDPPYTDCDNPGYEPWKTSDVQTLRSHLERLQGQWLVTLNDAPSVRAVFAGCRITAVDRAKATNNVAGQAAPRYREIVIQPAARP